MKVVTVNVPEAYIEAIKKLVGDDGLYPSRSELIRCAVREFLLKEMGLAKTFSHTNYEKVKTEVINESKTLVRIPIDHDDENGEPIRDFKTYKIIRRMDIN